MRDDERFERRVRHHYWRVEFLRALELPIKVVCVVYTLLLLGLISGLFL
jgi:hypothetical protein